MLTELRLVDLSARLEVREHISGIGTVRFHAPVSPAAPVEIVLAGGLESVERDLVDHGALGQVLLSRVVVERWPLDHATDGAQRFAGQGEQGADCFHHRPAGSGVGLAYRKHRWSDP